MVDNLKQAINEVFRPKRAKLITNRENQARKRMRKQMIASKSLLKQGMIQIKNH